jgi:hypothetical protein
MKCTGQTGTNVDVRYREYLHSFINNNTNSKFAHHLLENGHAFGKTGDVMEIVYFSKKGTHMDTIVTFFIYIATKKGNQLNDKNTVSHNKVFQVVLNRERRLTSHLVNTPLRNQYRTSQQADVPGRTHTHSHTHQISIREGLCNINLLQARRHRANKFPLL